MKLGVQFPPRGKLFLPASEPRQTQGDEQVATSL